MPLTPFFFDLLYLDGGPVIDEPANRRLAALVDAVPESMLIPRLMTSSTAEAQSFLNVHSAGHEGIMAKALDAPYEAATAAAAGSRSSRRTRSISWCWRPSGATAGGRAGSAISISVPGTRPAGS